MSNSNLHTYTSTLPICRCSGQPEVRIQTVKKQGPNNGKEFFCCSIPKENGGCNFFKFNPMEYGKDKRTFTSGKCKRCGNYGCKVLSSCNKKYTYGGIPIPKNWKDVEFVEYSREHIDEEEEEGPHDYIEGQGNGQEYEETDQVSKKSKVEKEEVPWKSIPQISNIQDVIQFVKEGTKDYDSSHDFSHAQRVANTAMEIINLWADRLEEGNGNNNDTSEKIIAPLSNSQIKVVIYSSYLHDLCDSKYTSPEESKEKVVNFLKKVCNDKEIVDIMDIIFNMSFSKEKKEGYPSHLSKGVLTLRDIVSDSDKIDALGKGGMERCIEYSHKIHPDEDDPDFHYKKFIEHCKEKLLLLKDNYIRTEEGKKIAERGHKYLEGVVEEYSKAE